MKTFLNTHGLNDIFSQKNHSHDFLSVRTQFCRERLSITSLLFAFLAGIWPIIDYLFLPFDKFIVIGPIMLILCFLYLGLYFQTNRTSVISKNGNKVFLFMIFALAFYVSSKLLIPSKETIEMMIIGNYFAPFLLVTLLALFPMTILEAIFHHGVILLVFISTEYVVNPQINFLAIGHTWLIVMMSIMVAWVQVNQLQMLLRLYREASYDVLTGLVNRRVSTKWLSHEIEESKKSGKALIVMLLDLDHFKKVNDNYGHLVGDEVLKQFGTLLNKLITAPGLAARFGGEEFFLIIPNTNIESAKLLAESIRQQSSQLSIETENDGEMINFTVSIGITELEEDDTDTSLISRVDEVLYQSKRSGRNQVSFG